MQTSININFKYTEKEYANAVKLYYMKSSRIVFDFIIAVTLIIIGSLLQFNNPKSVINIFIVVAGVLFLLILIYAIYINPKRIFRSEPKFKYEYFLSFSNDGVIFKTEHINSNLQWNHYVKFSESKEFYYLVYGRFMFTIIPKRAFENKSIEEEFKKLLIDKIKVR